MKSGIELIAEERKRQVEKEGWDEKHDSEHWREELRDAAICYAWGKRGISRRFDHEDAHAEVSIYLWPWEDKWWKPTPKNRIKELIKAGALIAAEIDRLQNAAE